MTSTGAVSPATSSAPSMVARERLPSSSSEAGGASPGAHPTTAAVTRAADARANVLARTDMMPPSEENEGPEPGVRLGARPSPVKCLRNVVDATGWHPPEGHA